MSWSYLMKSAFKILCLCGIISASYLAGNNHLLDSSVLNAQEKTDKLSKEEKERVNALSQSFFASYESLIETQKYRPAIQGINTFAVSVGGLDAIADLESGQGVDPETFAGLYADLAIPEISEDLGRDDNGRITYKNKVVQLYSISKLKALFAKRSALFGETIE